MSSPVRAGPRWRPTRWSLRRQVVVAAAAALVVLLGAGVGGFAVALDRALLASAQDSARTQAQDLSRAVSGGTGDTLTSLQRIRPEGLVVQVLAADGTVLASLGHDAPDTALTTARDVSPDDVLTARSGRLGPEGETYALAMTSLDGAGSSTAAGGQVLVVGVPLDVESTAVTQAVLVLGIGALVLLVLLLVGVDRAVLRALRPVTRITAQVRQISGARSASRVGVPPTGDEIAELATTMNAMLDRLARSDAAARRFVADASHELRSPLTTLRLQVETAQAGAGVPDPEVMAGELRRLQRLVEDLLTLARADDEGLVVAPAEVDLDDVVEGEARRLQEVWDGPLEVHLEPASVLGDAGRLGQALRNLIDNACRHSTGGVSVRMEVGPATAPGAAPGVVRVHVDNDGAPLDPADRVRVFDRFARLDDARERDAGGVGLGLAITAAVAAAHGGSVTTGAAPGGGCRFTLTVPSLTPSPAR